MKSIHRLSLKEEQKKQLDILRHFVEICRREGIGYFLGYGSLLGAVREHGFIEWDDDIDIWMLRNDYNHFMRVYSKYKTAPFFLQTFETDPHCLSPEMMRICIDNTCKWPEEYSCVDFHKGIYFDIFPLDNGFGDWRDKYYLFKMKLNLYLLSSKCLGLKDVCFMNPLKKVLYKLLLVISSENGLRKKINHIVERYSQNNNRGVMICFPTAYAGYSKCIFDSYLFNNWVYLDFEDMKLPAPKQYMELLRYMYGDDYMKPMNTKPNLFQAYYTD